MKDIIDFAVGVFLGTLGIILGGGLGIMILIIIGSYFIN